MGLELYFTAWLELDPDRPSGWGVGPIPWRSIGDYAKVFKIQGEQRDDFFYLVRAMDNAYVQICAGQNEHRK